MQWYKMTLSYPIIHVDVNVYDDIEKVSQDQVTELDDPGELNL